MTEYHQHDGFGQKEDNSYGKKRVKFHERGVHDDIKYSGPLSFQSFQILGWSCIVVTVILALIKIGIRLNPEDMKRFESFSDALMLSEKAFKNSIAISIGFGKPPFVLRFCDGWHAIM